MALSPTTRCMFMSGYLDELSGEDGMTQRLVLHKPFSIAVLASAVRAALDESEASEESA